MRFTFNWLKKYLSTNLTIEEIADKLSSIGLEVENVSDPKVLFENFQVAKIESAVPHPNSDHLKICIVDCGNDEKRQIICGAKNARAGLTSILALPGAVVPASGLVIKKAKLRGAESNGMLCSREELGLPTIEDGIIELDDSLTFNADVGEVLGFDGGIIDVSLTPNRGDCFSVKGIARDLAAAGAGKFIEPKKNECEVSFPFPLNVNFEQNAACKRYAPMIAFRVIRGLKNGKSPAWLKEKLQAAGMNSISAIVDLANLCLVDSGRPLHLYDLKKIDGDLSIRFARSNEKFVDIKGNKHTLRHDMLIAADDNDPLCLLGIMGSAKTACDENTTDILIESGLFDPVFISCTGSFLNITSDSRTRFERSIDKSSCIPGIEEITKSILDTCGGKASSIYIVGEEPRDNRIVTLTKEKLYSITGTEIDWNVAKEILIRLGLREVLFTNEKMEFLIPSWRADLNIEEDLVEEVIRIIGYDNIREESINIPVKTNDPLLKRNRDILAIKYLLASRGLSEIISYSFMKDKCVEAFRSEKKLMHLLNPISEDFAVMRPSLIPSLIFAAKRSLSFGKDRIALFEVGHVFSGKCEQFQHISGIRIGPAEERNWLSKQRYFDVFDVKADMFAVFDYLGIDEKSLSIKVENLPEYYHPSRSGAVYISNEILGYFGELHPKINKLFSVNDRIICFEIVKQDLKRAERCVSFTSKVFPKINRDFSFMFNQKIFVGKMISEIYKLDPRIQFADIFDSFQVSENEKSVGVCITLGANDRTLTEKEAIDVSNKVIEYIHKLGGELRKK